MSKLNEAIELCKDATNNDNFNKGLLIFNELISNSLLNITTRLKALIALVDVAPDLGNDKIAQSRDKLSHLDSENQKEELDKEINFLCAIVEQPKISSHERLMCTVALYNMGHFEYYFDLFKYLANDITVLVNHRREAIKYLMFSEKKSYIKVAKKILKSIIKTKEYPSDFRYETIASFNSKTGISTLFNINKLNIEYDEKLLYELQTEFFFDKNNDVRMRILSGQHMLDMDIVSQDKKIEIGEKILKIATNYKDNNLDIEDIENIRADAADVIIRLGTSEQKERARHIIADLGFVKGKRVSKLTEKSRNVYTDKQNVHNSLINKSVNQFIETLATSEDKVESYDNTHKEITQLIYNINLKTKQRTSAFKSLNRISIDTATFTDFRITTAEIFVHVWTKIKKSQYRDELEKRLVEELIDMCDTCASGHASRLINILSGYEFELKIEWIDQVKSNMAARMQKRISLIEDLDLQEKVVLGMMKDAEPEERDAFLKFVTEEIVFVKEELFKEFVGDKYITSEQFEKFFEEGAKDFI